MSSNAADLCSLRSHRLAALRVANGSDARDRKKTNGAAGENDYKIVGDRMAWKFEIFKGDEEVGKVNKKWGVADNYGVRVADGADEVDIILCGILIDHVYHDKDGKSR